MFACVLAVRNTKAKVEIKCFQQAFFEVMSLYHSEVVDGFISYYKLNPVDMNEGREKKKSRKHFN